MRCRKYSSSGDFENAESRWSEMLLLACVVVVDSFLQTNRSEGGSVDLP